MSRHSLGGGGSTINGLSTFGGQVSTALKKAPNGGATYVARARRPAGQRVAAALGKPAKINHPLLRSPEEGQGVEAKPGNHNTRFGLSGPSRRNFRGDGPVPATRLAEANQPPLGGVASGEGGSQTKAEALAKADGVGGQPSRRPDWAIVAYYRERKKSGRAINTMTKHGRNRVPNIAQARPRPAKSINVKSTRLSFALICLSLPDPQPQPPESQAPTKAEGAAAVGRRERVSHRGSHLSQEGLTRAAN